MRIKKKAAWKVAEDRVKVKLLGLMPAGYVIMNDIKYRYGNIDHVAIRPDGTIFLIETKSHAGRISTDGRELLVNGRPLKSNPISQVMTSIRWLRDLALRLSNKPPWIVAVVVFPNAKFCIRRSVNRVNVMAADKLIEFIRTYRRSIR
jgi:hypothetical protein